MKFNEHQAVLTPRILLVPYSKHHVPTYHEWMQDPDLQQATASEPLTLPEEYAMQQSWRNDADKLTFIVCLAPESLSDIKTLDSGIVPGSLDSPETMIGDVNLFLYPHEEDDEDEEGEAKDASIAAAQKKKVIGEIEIMIARKTNQGQGLGKAVLLSFVWYVVSNLGSLMEEYHASHGVGGSQAGSHLEYLRVKIDGNNTRSIKLFEGVGFRKVSETPNYFGELELRRPVHPDYAAELSRELGATPIPISYS